MRIKWYRHFSMAALFLIAHFGAVGCSSSASEQGDTEAVEENVSEDGSESAAAAEEGNVPAGKTPPPADTPRGAKKAGLVRRAFCRRQHRGLVRCRLRCRPSQTKRRGYFEACDLLGMGC